ncbi:MAG: hypothetical protein ACE368_15135 [Paracoccaceae bacterium]
MANILEIDGLMKSFGGIKATDNVNLAVEENELHAIIGPAAPAGRSARAVGPAMPRSGTIRFRGRGTGRRCPRRRARGMRGPRSTAS